MDIAPARAADAPDLLALRNHYVAHSFATFDEAPLTAAAVQSWMAGFADAGPHRLLVARQGLHRAVVGIALPNDASVRLHARWGFRAVGVFDEYAHKHGRPISSQWMQRAMDAET